MEYRYLAFHDIDLQSPFFDSLKNDYPDFEEWFLKKKNEKALFCFGENVLVGMLYVKIESEDENYEEFIPSFEPKKRLKIGTLKVSEEGKGIGTYFLNHVVELANRLHIDDMYLTTFDRNDAQKKLISFLEKHGFFYFGIKGSSKSQEKVYLKIQPRIK